MKNKFLSLVMMMFIFTAFSAYTASATEDPLLTPAELLTTTDSSAASSFVTADGPHFYLNGKPFYFAGANNYYLFYEDWSQVLEVLDDAKAMNLTVIRTWGFSDGQMLSITKSPFQSAPGVYNETTFRRMDQIINESAKRGLKLMIPLVNNWDDFGGMCQYVDWCNATIPNYNLCNALIGPGTGATAHDAFYTNDCTKDIYKDYVSYFLNRVNTLTGIKYKDDPTIFAWQLANEPRARSDTSGQTLYNWISEMSASIKSIDPNHLVTTGEDGFYLNRSSEYGFDGYDGQDFITHHQIPTIDFASMHMYDWTDYFSQLDNMLLWIDQHVIDAQTLIGKPVTLNEFGFKQSGRDASMQTVYDRIEEVNLNGDLFWILCDDTYQNFDGFCVYYPRDASTTSIITAHGTAMKQKTDTNHLPLISPISKIIVNEGQTVTIVVLAADDDGDPLSYSIDDSRYTRNGNVFTWQTGEGDSGVYYTTVTVNDGSPLNVSTSFDVIVRDSVPCTVPIDDMNITSSMVFCLDTYFLPNGVNVISNNVILDCGGSTIIGSFSGAGISVSGPDNVTIQNCIIEDFGTGISISSFSNTITIKSNTLLNNNIYASYMTNFIISENFIQDSDHLIYLFQGIQNGTIINNTLTDYASWGRGISLDTVSTTTIEDNIIQNGGTALYCWFSCRNNTIRENTFQSNSLGIGQRGISFFDNVFYHNSFIDNGRNVDGANFDGTNQWDWNNEGNYWSDYDHLSEGCMDDNGDFICDEPYVINSLEKDNYPFIFPDGWRLWIRPLQEGWNLFSIPIVLDNPRLPDALSSIAGAYSTVYAYINGSWYSYPQLPSYKKLTELSPQYGYWIDMRSDATLLLQGAPTEEIGIPLTTGWNLAGYPSMEEKEITVAIASIADSVERILTYDSFDVGQEWKSYDPRKPRFLNTLTIMESGFGYWIKVNQDVIWLPN